jgi:hypothetical protein
MMGETLSPNSNAAPWEELEGYIIVLLRWRGSKSERFFPCLLGLDGSVRWIKHREDSSFEPSHLSGFHLRAVRLRALRSTESSGNWVVDDVQEVRDPWSPTASPV